MAVEVLFIRHGEPAWERLGLSVDDPDLTDRGQQQAELLAWRLRDVALDRVFVSPLRRAQQTVAPLATSRGIEPETLDFLAEITNPDWEGTPVHEVEEMFAASRNRPVEEHWEGLPGGESFRGFHERVTTGLRKLFIDLGADRTHDDPPLYALDRAPYRVAIVAHTGTNSVSIGHLLGIRPVPWEWERFVSFHASVSTLRTVEIANAHAFSLFRFGDTSHLPDDLQTV